MSTDDTSTTTNPVSSVKSEFSSDPRMHFIEETGKWTYTDDDGVPYEYDEAQGAWFPMFNEQLIEAQQSAYSVPGVDEAAPVIREKRNKRKNVYTMDDPDNNSGKRQKHNHQQQQRKPTNTSVYVTNLPSDVTVEELTEVFSKCGLLMEDFVNGGPRIKLYKDDKNNLKGDALITYLKEESVTLACQLLDDTDLRPGKESKLRVQMAEFKSKESKPSDNQNDRKNNKPDKKIVQKARQKLEKKLDWFDEETGKKAERYSKIVILKHMFTLEEIEKDVGLILDLKEDIRSECEKLGEVTNVVLYDKEPEGVVSIRFKEPLSAEACILKMNGRFFGGRRVEAGLYDGKRRFQKSGSKADETEEEESARLEKYAKWLETGGDE
ncbi:6495_t:CDS:10 [Paraglomus occultum]|uniref:6495_t:CDS:1 n=1 Tax=Paraglomus occultum TaxID=144539 RepID=A0A9N8VR61_9GLOM|nr:6495_t:CDS:10 [Paraglomus occultum]